MAELALAAAVLQFADIGARLLISTSQLCNRFKDAPGFVRTLSVEVEQFILLVKELEIDSMRSSPAKDVAKATLDDCIELSSRLQRKLEKISITAEDTVIQKTWKSIVTTKKEEQIRGICAQLDRKKHTLTLWMTGRHSAQLSRIEEAVAGIDRFLPLMKQHISSISPALEQRMNQLVPSTVAELQSHFQHVDSRMDGLAAVSSFIASNMQLLQKGHSDLENELSSLMHALGPSAKSHDIQRTTIAKEKEDWQSEPRRRSRKHGKKWERCYVLPKWIALKAIRVALLWSSDAGSSSFNFPLTVINLVDEEKSPAFQRLRDHIQTWTDNCKWPEESRKVGNGGVIYYMGASAVKASDVETLHFDILRIFEANLASPYDRDSNNRTVLEELLTWMSRYRDHISPSAAVAYSELIFFLLRYGPQTFDGSLSDLILRKLNWATILQAPEFLHPCITQIQPETERILERLYRSILENDSGEIDLPPESQVDSFGIYISWPEMSDSLDLGPVSRAVLHKNEAGLQALIRRQANVNENFTTGVSPLHLSISWPVGVKLLLDAGAAVDAFDKYGFTPLKYAYYWGPEESIRLLLKENSTPFRSSSVVWARTHWRERVNLIEAAVRRDTRYGKAKSTAATFQLDSTASLFKELVCALTAQRQALRDFALERLSWQEAANLGLLETKVLDSKATAVVRALEEKGFQLPLMLRTEEKCSVFFYTETSWQAAQLYAMGFQDVDEYHELDSASDYHGKTPLHELCSSPTWNHDRLGLMQWFLANGADVSRLCLKRKWNALQFLSAHTHLNFTFSLEVNNRKAFELLVQGGASILACDECICACSESGCTPTILGLSPMSKRYYSWKNIMNGFSMWTRTTCHTAADKEHVWRHYARFLKFDRLSLTHTCCCGGRRVHREQSRKEVIEDALQIQDEESELIDALERWMEQFDTEFVPTLDFGNFDEKDAFERLDEILGRYHDIDDPAVFHDVHWQRRQQARDRVAGRSITPIDYDGSKEQLHAMLQFDIFALWELHQHTGIS